MASAFSGSPLAATFSASLATLAIALETSAALASASSTAGLAYVLEILYSVSASATASDVVLATAAGPF